MAPRTFSILEIETCAVMRNFWVYIIMELRDLVGNDVPDLDNATLVRDFFLDARRSVYVFLVQSEEGLG